MPSCFVSLVTWNSKQHLERCFAALEKQTVKDFGVVLVDNASTDDTREFFTRYSLPVTRYHFIFNKMNRGFAGAHNQGIQYAKSRGASYVLVLNPDVVLQPNTIQELVAAMKRHPRTGSVGVPLLRDALFIDSFGLTLRQWGKVEDRYTGMRRDDMVFTARDHEEEVLGISGACALYRLAALDDIAYDQHGAREYFDEDFFAYKEDADLALRLRRRGWESWLTYGSHAMHHRGIRHDHARASRPLRIQILSYKNHLALIFLHRFFSLCSWWRVFFYELGKGAYLFFRNPRIFFVSWKVMIHHRKRLREKRAYIEKKATVPLHALKSLISAL